MEWNGFNTFSHENEKKNIGKKHFLVWENNGKKLS